MKPSVFALKTSVPGAAQRRIGGFQQIPLHHQHIPTAAELDKVNVNRRLKRPWARKCYFWKPNWIPTERQQMYLSHLYSMFSSRLAANVEREMAAHTIIPTHAASAVKGDKMLEGEVAMLAAFTHTVPIAVDGDTRFNVHFVAHRENGKKDSGKVSDALALSVFLEDVSSPLVAASAFSNQRANPNVNHKTEPSVLFANQSSDPEVSQSISSGQACPSAQNVFTGSGFRNLQTFRIEKGAMEAFAMGLVADKSVKAKTGTAMFNAPAPVQCEPDMEMPQPPVPNATPLLSLFFPVGTMPQQSIADITIQTQDPEEPQIVSLPSSKTFQTASLPSLFHATIMASAPAGAQKSEMTYFFNNKQRRVMPLIHDPTAPDPE